MIDDLAIDQGTAVQLWVDDTDVGKCAVECFNAPDRTRVDVGGEQRVTLNIVVVGHSVRKFEVVAPQKWKWKSGTRKRLCYRQTACNFGIGIGFRRNARWSMFDVEVSRRGP